MKLTKPINENYAATIVEITSLVDLKGNGADKLDCDNVLGAPLLGFQAIVPKTTKVGDIGVVFTAETQLNHDYVSKNNLYRHSNLNEDPSKSGYIEDNRRVKAVKFRGHNSDALYMPLSSLDYTKARDLQVGDTFDHLFEYEVCRKYEVKRRKSNNLAEKNKAKAFKRVDDKFLPEHYDTSQYFRNDRNIDPEVDIVVTQKLHGTSIRLANTIVKRKLGFTERILQKLGVKIQTSEYDHVFGSRKVIKDPNNPDHKHFYFEDIWSVYGQKVKDKIPEGFVVYGELIGWTTNSAPLQKSYTYQVPVGEQELYVYRVATVTPNGITDLSWKQVKEWCNDHGFKFIPELWAGKHKDFNPQEWIDKKYYDEGYGQAVKLSADSPVDEGVCIRIDGLAPYTLKIKSPLFYEHESKMLDQEVLDMEEEGK